VSFKEVKLTDDYQAVCNTKEPTKASTTFLLIRGSETAFIKINNQVQALSMFICGGWEDGSAYLFKNEHFQVLLWELEEISETKSKIRMEVMTVTDIFSKEEPEMIFKQEAIYNTWPLEN
jgi:hypothetical protein